MSHSSQFLAAFRTPHLQSQQLPKTLASGARAHFPRRALRSLSTSAENLEPGASLVTRTVSSETVAFLSAASQPCAFARGHFRHGRWGGIYRSDFARRNAPTVPRF